MPADFINSAPSGPRNIYRRSSAAFDVVVLEVSPRTLSVVTTPFYDEAGHFRGAMHVARDVTAQRLEEAQLKLLLLEMEHRIRNLFALTRGLTTLSAKEAQTSADLAANLQGRLGALGRAHGIVMGDTNPDQAGVLGLLKALLAPYRTDESSITIEGDDAALGMRARTGLALLLHECATNSVKYGALSTCGGKIAIGLKAAPGALHLTWRESPNLKGAGISERKGFGAQLEACLTAQFKIDIIRNWTATGLVVEISICAAALAA
jgi:two-component sensor histidine kinase